MEQRTCTRCRWRKHVFHQEKNVGGETWSTVGDSGVLNTALGDGSIRGIGSTKKDANERGWFKTEPSQKNGKPDLSIILATALELAQAMEHLHALSIVHGDLTPFNVLLSKKATSPHGFTVKVADFGLCRDFASKTINTCTLGTVTHMPPELLAHGQLTKATDVYSFGVLLWTMWTGVSAWQGLRRTQVIYQITALLASLPIPATCPAPLKDIMKRCLNRERRERPTFADLVKELQRLASLQQRGLHLETSPDLSRLSAPALEDREKSAVSRVPMVRSSSSQS